MSPGKAVVLLFVCFCSKNVHTQHLKRVGSKTASDNYDLNSKPKKRMIPNSSKKKKSRCRKLFFVFQSFLCSLEFDPGGQTALDRQ